MLLAALLVSTILLFSYKAPSPTGAATYEYYFNGTQEGGAAPGETPGGAPGSILFAGGDGSPGNPYQISTCEELQDMNSCISCNYVLNNDIDCSGTRTWNWNGTAYNGFDPVATYTGGFGGAFTGTLDGRNHTISGLYINRTNKDAVGLFESLNGAVSDFGLEDVDITGKKMVGGIAGWMTTWVIQRSYTTGTIRGNQYVGGLSGYNGELNNCYSTANVIGNADVGGLGGFKMYETVADSYFGGTVTGNGLLGYTEGAVNNCFVAGRVIGGDCTGAGFAVNTYYLNRADGSPSSCWSGIVIPGDNEEYFFDPGNAPMSSWSFPPWSDFCDGWGYPILAWQNLTDVTECPGYPFHGAPMGGNGTAGNPYLITDCGQLQDMESNLTASYALDNDIDCSETRTWNWDGAKYNGFAPVGAFSGTFDGRNRTISGLYINRSTENNMGLFSTTTGVVKNVGLEGVSIRGRVSTGGIAGRNDGQITSCYTTGNVSGVYHYIGGLAGSQIHGSIASSHSSCAVSGSGSSYHTGGLVGYQENSVINDSYSIGTVSSGIDSVGGLVGYQYHSTINRCYNLGNVSGHSQVGGLAGWIEEYAVINNSYSKGSVSGSGSQIGGLVSTVFSVSSVVDSYSTGDVSGGVTVGGLIGILGGDSSLEGSYSTGDVSGSGWVGGFIGYSGFSTYENSGWWTGCGQDDAIGYTWETGGPVAEIDYNEPDYTVFYDTANTHPIYSSWQFPPWSTMFDDCDYPPLSWQPEATDSDGDGYPLVASSCHPLEDCNDSDAAASPGNNEICNDGIDNDCDGNADCGDTGCSSDPACASGSNCGDGTCSDGETCRTCRRDCGKCKVSGAVRNFIIAAPASPQIQLPEQPPQQPEQPAGEYPTGGNAPQGEAAGAEGASGQPAGEELGSQLGQAQQSVLDTILRSPVFIAIVFAAIPMLVLLLWKRSKKRE